MHSWVENEKSFITSGPVHVSSASLFLKGFDEFLVNLASTLFKTRSTFKTNPLSPGKKAYDLSFLTKAHSRNVHY